MKMLEHLKTLPPVVSLLETSQWGHMRHWLVRRRQPRDQSHYTHFLRLPSQFDALAGPVMEHVLSNSGKEKFNQRLRIVVVGCSIGAEVYTIASILKSKHPSLDFKIDAADIEASVLDIARKGLYTREQVYSNEIIDEGFIRDTFQKHNGSFLIRHSLAETTNFLVADIFAANLTDIIPPADIVFAQNFLIHMDAVTAQKAFDCIARLLKPRSVLFVDGIDLPVKLEATKRNGLSPLDYKFREIHDENKFRLVGWPWHYWGLEPFSNRRREWRRRYGTIFIRSA